MAKKKTQKTKVGNRKNQNKTRWRNFPLFLIEPIMRVAHAGESKYGTYNFLKGQYVNNCLDSLKRHLVNIEDPKKSDVDPETGENHLSSVAWNALVALYMIENRPELDDRYKTLIKRKKLK